MFANLHFCLCVNICDDFSEKVAFWVRGSTKSFSSLISEVMQYFLVSIRETFCLVVLHIVCEVRLYVVYDIFFMY